MMNDGLAALLRGKKQLQEEQEIRMSEMQKNCSLEINTFYERLEEWLSDLIEENMILTSYKFITDRHGLEVHYTKRFKLKAGKDEIEFIPNKRIAVGTTGRVEMKTKKGEISFIRDRDGIWKQVNSKSPLNVTTLTRTYFRELLKSTLS